MRIMFVLNVPPPGGAENHTFQLANTLASKGDLCTIVSLTALPGTALGSNVSSIEFCDGNKLYSIGTIRKMSRLIRAQRPDIVVTVNQRPLLFGVVSLRLASSKAKLVSVFHSSYLFSIKDHVLNTVYKPLFARADALIYVSQNQRRLWEQRGYRSDHATVIHNGIDLSRFSPRSAEQWRDRIRTAMGFGPLDYVIGMCARFRPEKNHRQLIDAIRILRSRGFPAKALLVGEGATQCDVEEYARSCGLLEHVAFAGLQEDVRPYVSAIDVGVLCSLGETLPLAPLEMMAIGIPVVISNVGGAAEIVRHGETGFLFPVEDTDGLVCFLEKLFDPAKREAFGAAASRFVRANFAAERMVEGYKDLFKALVCHQ
ncbi:glycosyltransferase [Bradyrhizobium sp. BWA-3-5]|uniref:glycosyltransferase n=1 Tax=Bradyrhizobium sp. BWA-3-5 TaxID=3080013 RepID=UPI00293E94F9|nr:glycosyltransferase [Bradyrhizobium sp. BWA-3-5]WOH67876.1 glycosyltransferase [Bradyrhizobium sp. BWA-3-5]